MEHSSIRNALSHKIYSVVYTTFKYHQHTFMFCHIFLSDYSVRAWWIYQRHPLNLKRMECWPHFLASQKPPKCLSELSIWRLQVAHTNIYRRKTDYVTLQLEQFVPLTYIRAFQPRTILPFLQGTSGNVWSHLCLSQLRSAAGI